MIGLATVLYPFAIYLGLGRVAPRWLALLLLAMALLRVVSSRDKAWRVAAAAAALLVLVSFLSNTALPLKLYPVLVNATLLAVFAISLRFPPCVVERLARMRDAQLPPQAIAYLRRVTLVWCAFFVFNGSIALATALFASDGVWALYNGLIAYLLMGLLFVGEWLMRQRIRGVAQ